MKLYEKIRMLRERYGMSLRDLHKKITAYFGDKALSYDSLSRIELGHSASLRIKTLNQISTALNISLKDLKEGTEEEESKIVSIIKARDKRTNTYVYNENAIAEIMTPRESAFLTIELNLEPSGSTREEEDPTDNNKHEKLVSGLHGQVLVYVGNEKHLIKRGDSVYFASNIPHHFENPSKKMEARCLIVQNPKSF